MKKSYIFLLMVCCLAPGLQAGNALSPKTKGTNPSDSLALAPAEESSVAMTWNDSVLHFPAYDIYCGWDTSSIHPGHYDFCNMDSFAVHLGNPLYCGYVHPFDGSKSSDFGYRRGRGHYGVDINLETGDPVMAAFEGRVRIAKRNKSYGNLVVIRHANGLETFYAHLSKLKVRQGDLVEAGQVIGLGGNTGHSYGSHLHFEVRYMGIPLNPNNFISFEEKKLLTDNYVITMGDFAYLNDEAARKASTKKSNRYRSPAKPKSSLTLPLALEPVPQKTLAAAPTARITSKPVTAAKAPASAKASAGKPVKKPVATSKSGARVYVVKKGDTLYKIAKMYGTTTDKICEKNGITTKTTLNVGRKLKV